MAYGRGRWAYSQKPKLIWHVKLELRDLKEILMQPQEPYFSLKKKKTILIILFYFFAN